MFSVTNIGRGLAAVALAVTLAACGGSNSPTGSTSSAPQPSPAAAASATLPAQPVCAVFSKEAVGQVIGRTIYSASNADVTNSAGDPALCHYYTDSREVDGVTIRWELARTFYWDEQMAHLGKPDSGSMDIFTAKAPELGNDAIRGTSQLDDTKTVQYWVLLRQKGLVVSVASAVTEKGKTNVPDAQLVALAKLVAQRTSTL